MDNREIYLIAINKAIKLLSKLKKQVKTRIELTTIKETQEVLSSLYYEIKKR